MRLGLPEPLQQASANVETDEKGWSRTLSSAAPPCCIPAQASLGKAGHTAVGGGGEAGGEREQQGEGAARAGKPEGG